MAVTEQSGRHRRPAKPAPKEVPQPQEEVQKADQKVGWFARITRRNNNMERIETRFICYVRSLDSNLTNNISFPILIVKGEEYKLTQLIENNLTRLDQDPSRWILAGLQEEPLFLRPAPLHRASSQPLGRNPYNNS